MEYVGGCCLDSRPQKRGFFLLFYIHPRSLQATLEGWDWVPVPEKQSARQARVSLKRLQEAQTLIDLVLVNEHEVAGFNSCPRSPPPARCHPLGCKAKAGVDVPKFPPNCRGSPPESGGTLSSRQHFWGLNWLGWDKSLLAPLKWACSTSCPKAQISTCLTSTIPKLY